MKTSLRYASALHDSGAGVPRSRRIADHGAILVPPVSSGLGPRHRQSMLSHHLGIVKNMGRTGEVIHLRPDHPPARQETIPHSSRAVRTAHPPDQQPRVHDVGSLLVRGFLYRRLDAAIMRLIHWLTPK